MTLLRYCLLMISIVIFCGLFAVCSPSFRPAYTPLASEDADDDDEDEDDEDDEDEEDEDEDDENDDTDDDDKNKLPYQALIDTFAFMSCEGEGLDDEDGFQLKAASYAGGGVQLIKSFRNKTISEIEEYKYHDSRPFIAYESSLTKPIYILRKSLSSYLELFLNSDSNYLNQLNNEEFSKTISNSSGGTVGGKLNRDALILSFSYKKKYFIKDEDDNLYGRSYTLHMDKKHKRYIIDNIDEELIQSGSSQGSWVCDHYEIRRHERHTADDEPECRNNDNNQEEYGNISQILGESWNINTSSKCISPKSSRNYCYYKVSKQRGSKVLFGSSANDCADDIIRDHCPHYFSFCFRE